MLQELDQLANYLETPAVQGGLPPIGYESATVEFAIDLNNSSIVPLYQEPDPKRKSTTQQLGRRVLTTIRLSNHAPALLDDKLKYILGTGSNGPKCQPKYRELLGLLLSSADPPFPWAPAIQQLLDCPQLAEAAATQTGLPLAEVADKRCRLLWDGEPVVNDPQVRIWWRNHVLERDGGQQGNCSITGQTGLIVSKTIPATVKGIPGAQLSGAKLSCFDKPSMCSWGLQQNANAPLLASVGLRSHAALQVLIEDKNHHAKLGNQLWVFWGTEGEGIKEEMWQEQPAGAMWRDPSAFTQIIGAFDDATKSGTLPPRKLDRPFFLASLRAHGARIAITRWETTTIRHMVDRLQWFRSAQCPHQRWRPLALWQLRQVAFHKAPKPPETAYIDDALLACALQNAPLPDQYAQRLLDRLCAEGDLETYWNPKKVAWVLPQRIQALALYLASRNINIPMDNQSLPFALGQACFWMAQAQARAQKRPLAETNVVQALRGILQSPSRVAGLFPNFFNHLKELGSVHDLYLERFSRAIAATGTTGDCFPESFSVEDQALFMVGFAMACADNAENRHAAAQKKQAAQAEIADDSEIFDLED
jgi:hypothetical protein